MYKTVLHIVQANTTPKGIIMEIFAVHHNGLKSDFETATESALYFKLNLFLGNKNFSFSI